MPYSKEPANKVITTFMSPALASTYLAFHPLNHNIITIVTENSIIHIYYLRVDEVIRPKFKCHQKHIPGFAFSVNLKVMVSSEADAQVQVHEICSFLKSLGLAARSTCWVLLRMIVGEIICRWSIDAWTYSMTYNLIELRFWNMDTWDKRKLVRIQLPTGKAPTGDTQVQFYSDQILLLVLVKTQPALYDGAKTECIQQWMPRDVLPAPITCAAYSPNNQLYGALSDSNVAVFDTDSLKLRCRIAMSVYFVEASRNRFKVPQPGSNAGIGAVLVTAQEVEAHSEKGLLVGAVAESDATEDPIFPGKRMSKMKDAAGVSLRVFLATPGGRFLLLLRLSSTKLLLLC
ncbi:putative transcription factor WD40-like family [Rosa chinensis]|uniref:Putative transcription factor WD40-like family n=1 Tax=Rosa chinensis TaxID=74649 RepID=A0A2P6PTD5_ROSCH|nr:putative transcription factor WD40-like family [Rosa chinensis]